MRYQHHPADFYTMSREQNIKSYAAILLIPLLLTLIIFGIPKLIVRFVLYVVIRPVIECIGSSYGFVRFYITDNIIRRIILLTAPMIILPNFPEAFGTSTPFKISIGPFIAQAGLEKYSVAQLIFYTVMLGWLPDDEQVNILVDFMTLPFFLLVGLAIIRILYVFVGAMWLWQLKNDMEYAKREMAQSMSFFALLWRWMLW